MILLLILMGWCVVSLAFVIFYLATAKTVIDDLDDWCSIHGRVPTGHLDTCQALDKNQ